MRAHGRTTAPPRRLGARLRGIALVGCVVAASCAGSSDGLGEANGGIGIVERDPAADTRTASTADGPLHEDLDDSDTAAGPPDGGAISPGGAADQRVDPVGYEPDGGDEPGRLHRALSAGVVPGLGSDDPFREALAAYWSLLHRARQEPWAYDEAELDAVAVGAGRERFVQRIEHLGAAESIVPPDESVFEVRLSDLRIGSEVAVGEECVLDDFVHVVVRDARTGKRYDPPLVTDDRVFSNRYGVTFQRVEGTWKVADRVLIEDGEGVSGCARDW